MAVSPRRNPVKPKSAYRFVFLIGLLALAMGAVLLVLSVKHRSLRPAGAVCLLLGVVLAGSCLTNSVLSGPYANPLADEPPWSKLARGEGPPRLLPPGKSAAPASTSFAIDQLIDFPVADAPRRPATPATQPAARPAMAVNTWTAALFDRLSPQQFDAVCATLFAQSDLETRVQSHGAAGGVTVWFHSPHAQPGKDSLMAVALCKLWPGQPVGVREMHPLMTLMTARGLKRATYATASVYTDHASKFAKYNGIDALDRSGLLKLIATRTPAQQQALLAIALGKR